MQRSAWQPPRAENKVNTLSIPTAKPVVQIDFNKGDMVQHTAFGRGMILSVIKMGNDALLEIAFDRIGTKKLMAKSASAHLKRI
jgi:DNA helicase-2/ATP-dependent DNA helicase PcrA